jgi:pimeloyl-ACP methyl ester carboxylesterase
MCKYIWLLFFLVFDGSAAAQPAPYDKFPEAKPPYYRVRYEPSPDQGRLMFGVNYTLWLPPGEGLIRGIIVHQHGCGEGSCRSGLTGAYDLHWQSLAEKHHCGLLSPAYEQPDKADCQMWCDPRNGSDDAFQRCLVDFAEMTGRKELSQVPWALWGHSGGGHWAGGMVMLHPEQVVAAWLRSGVPLLSAEPGNTSIRPHDLPELALQVPMMCNLGTKEGVTVKQERFAGVWPANQKFFLELRSLSGLVGVAIDPLTSHECGNQRYLAIPWLDACLTARLPEKIGAPLRSMPSEDAWLTDPTGQEAWKAVDYPGESKSASWLPNETIATRWKEYVTDTNVSDATPPPSPFDVRVVDDFVQWNAKADLESGISHFVIERDGVVIGTWPEKSANPFGRPVFQNLQYSDTPPMPLIEMKFKLPETKNERSSIIVRAVNTVGLQSEPSISN